MVMFKIANSWYHLLQPVFETAEFKNLQTFLQQQYNTKHIYPKPEQVFAAINFVKPQDVKVVIVGQDPYHQPGQAHGLSFSVQEGVRVPPSLKNIFKEIHNEFGTPVRTSGNLEYLAKQGVLLINRVLTVEESKPNAHKGMGWEAVTDKIIDCINQQTTPVVFLLWGGNAKTLLPRIDQSKHAVFVANHPSPMSANRGGWFGNDCFLKTNKCLQKWGKKTIEW